MGQFVSSGLCPLNPFQSLHLRRNFAWESVSFPFYAPCPGVAKHSGTFFWFTQSSSFFSSLSQKKARGMVDIRLLS